MCTCEFGFILDLDSLNRVWPFALGQHSMKRKHVLNNRHQKSDLGRNDEIYLRGHFRLAKLRVRTDKKRNTEKACPSDGSLARLLVQPHGMFVSTTQRRLISEGSRSFIFVPWHLIIPLFFSRCLSVSIRGCFPWSVCLNVCLSVFLSVYLNESLFVHLPVNLSGCLYAFLLTVFRLSGCLFVYLSVFLPVYLLK